MDPKYYESHITIEPVFGTRLDAFKCLSSIENFKVAKLLMQKDREATESRSDKDSFCTGHALSFDVLSDRMKALVQRLRDAGFAVWRYKIEAVLVDERVTA